MKKSVDFSKGIRGRHANLNLKIVGAVESVWAVCITQADKNLIPLKLYRIEVSENSEEIKVINEKGETVFYPKNWFAPLDISPKTVGLLKKVA
jgi:hypothetical protein